VFSLLFARKSHDQYAILHPTVAGAIGLTAVSFVLDVKEGCMDRVWAAGVRPSEIMVSVLAVQFTVLATQIVLLLFFALYVFSLPLKGSIFLVFLLACLLGLSGMLYGLVIAALVDNVNDAMNLALGSFFPFLLLSGVIWPIQVGSITLAIVNYYLPCIRYQILTLHSFVVYITSVGRA
jgi:ABC-type polysaccharide/polyol phosphate export permease